MVNLGYGLFAGFVATLFMSAIIWLQERLGIHPALDVIELQSGLLHHLFDLPDTAQTGWLSNFFFGTIIYGGIFGLFNHRIPGRTALGIATMLMLFGWLSSMLVFMPLAEAGFFALKISTAAPFILLAMHILFGVMLGYVYAHLHHHRITACMSPSKAIRPQS